jgi:proteasome accessory factor C
MAKYSGPLQEVSRALDLVPYLSTHSYISISELAQEFEVSEKEIISELTALSMCGLPGYTAYELIDISFDSGFVTIRNHEPLNITRALSKMELTSLLIGLELLRESVTTPSESINGKIHDLIAKLKPLTNLPLSADPIPFSREIQLIETAISQGKWMEFTYISTVRDEKSQRVVDPQALRRESPHLYLDGYCSTSEGGRSFRLDRMSDVLISELNPTQVAEDENALHDPLHVNVKIYNRLRRHRENLGLTSVPGTETTMVEAYSQGWIERALLAASPDVEVLEPLNLRHSLKAKAGEILALYSAR